MDPLSITAGIIAVMQAANALIEVMNAITHASKDQQQIALELINLQGLLQRLRFRVQDTQSDDPWFEQVKQLAKPDGPLDQLKRILDSLKSKAAPASGIHQVKQKILWKYEKAGLAELLDRIERLKSLIGLALSNDHFTLSQAIYSELSTARANINQLNDHSQDINTGLSNVAEQVKIIRALHDREQQSKLESWLRIPDPTINYNTALKNRQKGTGSWFLTSEDFQKWKDSPSFLWLHGKPGCGKTILCSTIIEDIQNYAKLRHNTIVAYFYFDFNDGDKQSLSICLRSILYQLYSQLPELQTLDEAYTNADTGRRQPKADVLLEILYNILDRPEDKFIILDALDESKQHEEVLQSLKTIFEDHGCQTHLLATSRPEQDIIEGLSNLVTRNIDIQSSDVYDDIQAYIDERLQSDSRLRKWPEPVQQEIRTKMLSKSDGMFRWVFCQLDAIRSCIQLSKLRKTLDTLPKTLDETYDRILKQIEVDGNLEEAIFTLQWLCFSIRPLDQSELLEMHGIDTENEQQFDSDNCLHDIDDVMIICSSLVSTQATNLDSNLLSAADPDTTSTTSMDNNLDTSYVSTEVRLAHFSVQEYLVSNRSIFRDSFEHSHAHRTLAKASLTYLLYLCKKEISSGPKSRDLLHAKYPFADYAARYWWQHVARSDDTAKLEILPLARKLFSDRRYLQKWTDIFNIDEVEVDFYKFQSSLLPASRLYLAASIGYLNLAHEFIDQGDDVNTESAYFSTALVGASRRGHLPVVQMLLQHGAEVNGTGSYGDEIALIAAAASSDGEHAKTVEALLAHGADPNMKGLGGNTALIEACYNGYAAIVKLLLNKGADVNYSSAFGKNALLVSADGGYPAIVRMLLEKGAIVDATDERGYNALASASRWGYVNSTRLLLEYGADPNQLVSEESKVSARGQQWLIRLFLERGHLYVTKDNEWIKLESVHGDEPIDQIIRMVVDWNKWYGGALVSSDAIRFQRENIVTLFFEHGMDRTNLDWYERWKLAVWEICVLDRCLEPGAEFDWFALMDDATQDQVIEQGYDTRDPSLHLKFPICARLVCADPANAWLAEQLPKLRENQVNTS